MNNTVNLIFKCTEFNVKLKKDTQKHSTTALKDISLIIIIPKNIIGKNIIRSCNTKCSCQEQNNVISRGGRHIQVKVTIPYCLSTLLQVKVINLIRINMYFNIKSESTANSITLSYYQIINMNKCSSGASFIYLRQ